jgi:hypothetical protein
MTEASWGDEAATKKKRVPTWLWFCGGGCLIAVILLVIALAWALDQVKDLGDPEVQLAALSESLPFDELPPETEFEFAIPLPFKWYIFSDRRGYAVVIFDVSASQAEELRRTLLEPAFTGQFMGMGGRRDPEAATVRVQGRDVSGVRFFQVAGASSGDAKVDARGPSIILDVTPEGRSGLVAVQIFRPSGEEKISDEEVIEFLKPFHVGPDR